MPSLHILVVDNSPVIRKIVASVLESEGHRVVEAEDGLQALDCIAMEKPDIVFTDLVMPKIDGNKLSYIIRNTPELRDTFLVVLSGVAMEDDGTVMELGADVCIAKGPGATMKVHILDALARYFQGHRDDATIKGMEGLFPREVTRELLVSKRHREIILAEMSEGVVELDSQGRIVMINRAAIRLFEAHEARILGRPLAEIVPEAETGSVERWINALSASEGQTGQALKYTYDNPLSLGERQVTMTLLPVAEEEDYFIVGILQDVTRRKHMEARQRHLERELQRIQKLDAMSLMASGIAHDFNNLLTVINGNVEMGRYLTKDEQVAHLLGESARALELTMQLIRQFTTFSDTYLPQKSKVDLETLIRDVLARELNGSAVLSRVSVVDSPLAVNLDADLAIQLFTNLARNSLDAMGGEGRIEVNVDKVDGAEEGVQTGQPVPGEELIRVRFHDSGPGIDSEIMDKVFDPYFSTKQKGVQKGMGLGLTIVHSIVKKHGGMVWISSNPGEGCTVWLYFPERIRGVECQPGTSPGEAAKRVLVMDDEEMMRIINEKMFTHFGCDVTLAANGEEAVEHYQRAMAAGKSFDLILLDLNVHDGMDGLTAARRIAEADPEARLVAVSGDGDSEILVNFVQHGFVAALAKPFSLDSVQEMIRRYLCS